MPETTYKIDYQVPPEKAVKGLDAIEARLLKFEHNLDRVAGKLKAFGVDHTGIAKYVTALQGLDAHLKTTGGIADKAEASLKGVGKDNRAVTSLTARLKELEAELAKVAAAANAATPTVAGVGSGGMGGGRGGNGTGGGMGGPAGVGIGRSVAAGLGRHLAYSAFRQVVGAAASGAADRREFFSQNADMASDYRKDLQEVAVLEGKSSVSDEDIKKDLAFQKKTLMNADESREYRLEFGGAVAPALARGNISKETAAGLEPEAARFGLRYGLDPRTTGRMAGLLGNFGKVPSVGAGVGQMAEAAEQLNIFGVGSVKGMMPSMIGLGSEMLESEEGGRFKDFQSLAARMAASTVQTGGRATVAATRIRQSNRLLRKFNGKEEEAFLRQAGITPEDDYEAAIRKIAPHIAGPNGDLTLSQNGFGNSTERAAVIAEAKMNGVVDEALKDPRMGHARANAEARNNEFASSQQGQQRGAENAEFASRIETGLAGERLKTARANARARLTREGRLKPRGVGESLQDKIDSAMDSFGAVSGEDLRVDKEAAAELAREGKKVGIDVYQRYPQLDPTRNNTDRSGASFRNGTRMGTASGTNEAEFQSDFAAASSAIEAAKMIQRGGAMVQAGANALARSATAGQQGSQPPPPSGPAAGNGGAGVNPGRR